MSIRPVLLIRPDANERDAAALDAHGVPSTIEPWLRVEPADADGARRVAGRLDAAGPQTVLAVTSPRTWRFWSRQVGAAELAAAASAAVGRGMRVYATGRATGSSLPPALARRVRCAATGAALAELILAETPDAVTAPVALLPGSAAGRSDLPDALAAAGWQVVRAGVYRTATASCRPVSADLLVQGAFSAVVLRSPSAVAALRTFVGDVPADVALVAAGPTTARAGREAGLTVAECAGAGAAELAACVARVVGGTPAASAGAPPELPVPPASPGLPALPADHPARSGVLAGSPFLAACRGVTPSVTPVWFMRQAGRSLPEYRAARAGTAMLDSCLDPELAAELTLQPVRRYGVDAAILYSDIVVPLRLAGVDVDIEPGVGPVLAHPVAGLVDVAALPELTQAALDPIRRAVGRAVARLGATPLIGFAGAPYTVASYLVEGRPRAGRPRTRALLHHDPETWTALLDWVCRADIAFLRAQVLAGASAVQLFDSWVGELTLAEYLVYVQPASGRVLRAVAGVPRIHFGTGTARLLAAMRDAGADVMGVAADLTLAEADALLGGRTPLQGNVDPALLAAPAAELDRHVAGVLASGRVAPAHILNLAHGVPQDTDPAVLARIVHLAHTACPAPTKGQ